MLSDQDAFRLLGNGTIFWSTLIIFYKERSDFVTSWTFSFFHGRSLKSFFRVSFFYSRSLKSLFNRIYCLV